MCVDVISISRACETRLATLGERSPGHFVPSLQLNEIYDMANCPPPIMHHLEATSLRAYHYDHVNSATQPSRAANARKLCEFSIRRVVIALFAMDCFSRIPIRRLYSVLCFLRRLP